MATTRHGPLLLALGVLAGIAVVGVIRYRPPAAAPASAPDTSFSAARARTALARVLGPERPHPVGSAEADAVRNRLLGELGRLGLRADVQEVWLDGGAGRAVRVRNVVAHVPDAAGAAASATGRKAILLAAHYDSVGAGPGASDDGVGIATLLEVARALTVGPPLERPVVLLFDDGEEAGLLGARAFVDEHPLADAIHAAINVEARGTRGPSLMFETGANNLALIRLLARHVDRPNTSSLFESFYRAMPNDTDFTIFRRAGMIGYNFAIIGDAASYHTPNDDLAHAHPASLQHHGDNVLALTRALARTDDVRADGDAAFFDVFGLGVVVWPIGWTLPIALLGLALVLANGWIDRRYAGALRGAEIGAVTCLVAVAGIVLVAYGLLALAVPIRGWLLLPPRLALAAIAWSVAVAAFAARAVAAHGFWPVWCGTWTTIAFAGAVLAVAMPGAAYCLALPAIVAGAAGLVARTLRRGGGDDSMLAAIAPIVALAVLLAPVALGLADAFGPNIAGPVAPIAAALIPVCVMTSRRATRSTGFASLALAAAVVVSVVIASDDPATRPQRASLIHHRTAAGDAQWYAAPSGRSVPGVIANALGTRPPIAIRDAHRSAIVAAPIDGPPVDEIAPPTLEIRRSRPVARGRRFRMHVTSPRGATIASVRFPKGFLYAGGSVVADGERTRIRLPNPGADIGARVTIVPLPDDGATIDVTIRPVEGPFEGLDVVVSDVTPGLPDGTDALRTRRDAIAVPHGDGDLTIASRRVRLPPE